MDTLKGKQIIVRITYIPSSFNGEGLFFCPFLNSSLDIVAKMSTTPVRSAVATLELTFWMPHLARIAVAPANSADKNARTIHTYSRLLLDGFSALQYILFPQKVNFAKRRMEKQKLRR
ncbi:MAG TPA: hypothetical protein IAD00_06195 [Candidatus Fimenecus stercoravium]|nr:hypothetical protein [Candidatus Fimenecus stercoravium]